MVYDVYVGSYMGEQGGDGIYLCRLDTEKRSLTIRTSYPEESKNPSFLAVTRDRVFAVSELPDCGYITSFRRDGATGELEQISRIRTEGTDMCHLCLWPDGRFLSAANYRSGSLLVCRVDEDGRLGEICDFKQHQGVGYDCGDRQEGPHVHSTAVSRDGKRLYAADLGLDQVFCYEIAGDGKLKPGNGEMQIHTPAGMGPRHFVFSGNGKYLYLLTELGSRLFVYESADGGRTYTEIQNLNMLPENYKGISLGADIHFSADGRYLYVSNRGANTIAAFGVCSGTGKLQPAGSYSCCGDFPRNFCLTPDNLFLLAANQKSGNVVLCGRDPETGAIGSALSEITVPEAVFVTAWPAKNG